MTRLILFFILSLSSISAFTQNLNMGGVVNQYTKVNAIITNCRIKVADPQIYAIGQQVLIIQMKGADIDKQNNAGFGDIVTLGPAGLFEFNYIDTIFGDTIDLVYALKSPDYNVNARLQMISVPTADVLNLTGTVLAQPWNGNTGGVVVMEARDSIVVAADINVNGLGFRGGVRSTANYTCSVMGYSYGMFVTPYHGAYKGESFVLTDGNHITGRGAWATGGGGGNNHNTGGGGGANIASGGLGGKQSFVNSGTQGCNDTTTHNGGIGGKGFNYANFKDRVFFGGGGGGGHQNDLSSAGGGEGGSGGPGGGIIILVSPLIHSYNRTLFANGSNQDSISGRDGGGGGGAGGSILLFTQTVNGTLNIQAKGGKGADNNSHNNLSNNLAATHGPGGGGGGGYIGYSASVQLANISPILTGGVNGTILNSGSNHYGGAYGSTSGGNGTSIFGLTLPRGNVNFCKPTIIDAYRDQGKATKNIPLTVQVKNNDLFNRSVRVTICTPPQYGSAAVQNFDSITYTPNTGFVGKDSALYCLCTLLQPPACDSAWLVLEITEVTVIANDDVALTYLEYPVSIPVLNNDQINVPVGVSTSNPPLYGSVQWNGSSYIYTPAQGFTGTDSFTYSICSSTDPVACDTATVVVTIKIGLQLNNDFVDVRMNESSFIYPRRNDSINVPSVLNVYEFPQNGSLVVQNGDSLFYTPNPNFFGYDTLKYRVCSYNPINICDSAIVYIRIVPMIKATDDAYSLYMHRTSRKKVVENDTIFGTYTSSLLQFPTKGIANIQGDSIIYQAGLYYQGKDTLKYLICSNLIPGYCDTAQVVYTMEKQVFAFDDVASTLEDVSVNSAVKQNDTEFEPGQVIVLINPKHGSAFVGMNDSLRYTPSPDFFGRDSLRYALCTINLPRICDSAWLHLTVFGLNDAPIAAFDTASTYTNRFRDIPVMDNDKDPDGDPITITFVNSPNNGTSEIQGNVIRYIPARNYTGTDRFRYAICDNAQPGLCDTAEVFITILERTELVIQNGLTPNMDGINDYWVVGGIELVNENELIILNRWGAVVWQKTGYDNTWNGVNMQGEPLPEGTYFYVIRVPEEERVYKGFIVIKRD